MVKYRKVIYPSGNGRRAATKSAQYSKSLASVARSAGVMKSRMMPVAGITRVSGYYGRFANGGENKFFDTTRASHAPGTSGTISNLSLNLIPQGVTESTRVGRKCTINKLMIHGNCALPTTAVAGETSDLLRFIIYLDKQANGATAAVTDILESAAWASFNNLSNSQRFQILADKHITLNCGAGSGRGSTDTLSYAEYVMPYFFFKKCKIPVEFSATTGAITEIRSNNIGVLCITVGGEAVTGYTARVRFSDN